MRHTRRFLGTLAVLGAFGFAAGCADKPSKADCEKYLDHIIKVEQNAGGAGGKLPDSMKKDVKKQAEQVKENIRKKFMKQCRNDTSPAVVACGLKAKSREDVAKCHKKS